MIAFRTINNDIERPSILSKIASKVSKKSGICGNLRDNVADLVRNVFEQLLGRTDDNNAAYR